MSTSKTALFFAVGASLQDAVIIDGFNAPDIGNLVQLKSRSLHVRSTEHCTRPCCKDEGHAMFRVTGVRIFSAHEHGDVINRVLSNRAWDEGTCRKHEGCSLFDSYTLMSYLGIQDLEGVTNAAIIDVTEA